MLAVDRKYPKHSALLAIVNRTTIDARHSNGCNLQADVLRFNEGICLGLAGLDMGLA